MEPVLIDVPRGQEREWFDLLGAVERMCGRLGVPFEWAFSQACGLYLRAHPDGSAGSPERPPGPGAPRG